MLKNFKLAISIGGIALAIAASSCGKSGNAETAKAPDAGWNVSIHRVISFNDSTTGVGVDYDYTVADTARVNSALKEMKRCGNVTVGWTIPVADGSIWLVAYENEPLLIDRVQITEEAVQAYGGDIQVGFRFSNAGKWAEITEENIGQRLAVVVDGQLMSAPQVNTQITSGNCTVTIPDEKIHRFLPELDLEKINR